MYICMCMPAGHARCSEAFRTRILDEMKQSERESRPRLLKPLHLGGKRVTVDVAQPKTEAERCAVASHFRDLFELDRVPMVIDTMDNAYAQLYAPWPLRFHVVDRDGRLALVTEPVNARFDFSEVRDALLACLA